MKAGQGTGTPSNWVPVPGAKNMLKLLDINTGAVTGRGSEWNDLQLSTASLPYIPR